MSITPYGEAEVPLWAQSAFKDVLQRIVPKGTTLQEAEEYFCTGSLVPNEQYLEDLKLIEAFLADTRTKVTVIKGKYPHGDITHYTQ